MASSKKSSPTTSKVRKVAFDEFKNILPELFAIALTQVAFQGAGKISSIIKGAISGIGKLSGDTVDAGDIQKISGLFKQELRKENMPKSYNDKLEVVMDKYLDKMHSALMIEDDGKRSLEVRELKRELNDEVRNLDQQYQELSFEERIMAFLDDGMQRKHDEMKMTTEEETEYIKLRQDVKSVDVFKRILEQSSNAQEFIRRLNRNVAKPPKPDTKKEFEKGVKQVMESGKAVIEAFDKGIKDLFPYEKLRLPNMKSKETWADYWNRVIAAADVQSQKQSGEDDAALKKRLMADKKFVSIVERKLKERNQRLRTA